MWIMTNSDEYRGLEGTGIYCLDEQHVEHIARRAAELGDAEVEALCDRVLSGHEDLEAVIGVIDHDDNYRAWVTRGQHTGWERRASAAA